MFLSEDQCESDFASKHFFTLRGVDKLKQRQREQYKKAIEKGKSSVGYVRRGNEIVKVEEAITRRVEGQVLHGVKVYRRNNKELISITEADLENLELKDIETLYKHISILLDPKKYKDFRIALEKYMRQVIFLYGCEDLQMAMEAVQEFVNLTPPLYQVKKQIAANLYSLVVVTGKVGICFPSEDRKKKFFMLNNEVQKFCDGTLKMLLPYIVKLYKVPQEGEVLSSVDIRFNTEISHFEDMIVNRLRNRNIVRKFEKIFGVRTEESVPEDLDD